jgi:hypothetical protein
MFEVIEDTNTSASDNVVEHIQGVFNAAKQLTAKKVELKAIALERQKIANISRKITELSAVNEEYRDTLQALEVEGVDLNKMYHSAIQSHKQGFENRLVDLGNYRADLEETLKELEVAGSLLESQSDEYAEKLADGDIAGADLLEKQRNTALQENDKEQQEVKHKIDGVKNAENLLKADISICAEIEKVSRRSLLLSQYQEEKNLFDAQLEELTVVYKNLDGFASELWGNNYHYWDHLYQLTNTIRSSIKNGTLQDAVTMCQNRRGEEERFAMIHKRKEELEPLNQNFKSK